MSNLNEQEINSSSSSIPAIVEAMIFASSEPVTADEICQALLREDSSLVITSSEISSIIVRLNESYSETGRSFSIVHRGRGYTFLTDVRFHPWLQYIQHENVSRKISQSAVETLAIIAYKQPITKPEIEQIRGVDSGYILRTLMEKKLIVVAGRRDSPGKPLLYRTSDTFLLHFGISSVEELPKPREIDEILKDDDMAEHRQLLLELRTQLEDSESNPEIHPLQPFRNSAADVNSTESPSISGNGDDTSTPSSEHVDRENPTEDDTRQTDLN